jgi:hypothetical protein
MKTILICISLILLSCKKENENISEFHEERIELQINEEEKNKKSLEVVNEQTKKSLYSYEDEMIKQTIDLEEISKSKVKFSLLHYNKKKDVTSSLNGVAEIKKLGDVELDEDEEGEAYPVDEYIYMNKDCYLSIRIEKESKVKLRIMETECNPIKTESFQSNGILKLQQ